MKIPRLFYLSLLIVVGLHWGGSFANAQLSPAGKTTTIRGKIVALRGQDLLVATSGGEILAKLSTGTTLIGEAEAELSDIVPGLYVGASAQKQADGSFRASQINIFRAEERGLLEGHRPQTSLPNSTMTNATIEVIENLTVQDVTGRMLTLKFKEGEVKVFVPPTTRITRRITGNREMLKPNAEVRVQGTQAADGVIAATQIIVSVINPR